LSDQATFAKEVALPQDSDHSLLATLGGDCQLHIAILDVKHRISFIALRKDGLLVSVIPRDRLRVDPSG
jgi:hypothetical protein